MICLDTLPLIWGVQGAGRPSQSHMVERTRGYLRDLETRGQSVLIPAPVLYEYLLNFPPEAQKEQLVILQRQFIVGSLDLRAACLAAELQARYGAAQLKATRSELGLGKQEVKIDFMILAIAIVNKAEVVISEDLQMPKFAQGQIMVTGVPEVPQ